MSWGLGDNVNDEWAQLNQGRQIRDTSSLANIATQLTQGSEQIFNNVTTSHIGKPWDTRKHFFDILQKWEAFMPMSQLWLVAFDIPPIVSDAAMKHWGERHMAKDWGVDLVRGRFENSLMHNRQKGCGIAQTVSIPVEQSAMETVGPSNRGFLKGPVMHQRQNFAPVNIEFFETTLSFLDFVLRPWAILASHYGLLARPEADPTHPVRKLTTDLWIVNFARAGTHFEPRPGGEQPKETRGMIPRKVWLFKDCVPVNIGNERYSYTPEGKADRRNTEWNFRKYQVMAMPEFLNQMDVIDQRQQPQPLKPHRPLKGPPARKKPPVYKKEKELNERTDDNIPPSMPSRAQLIQQSAPTPPKKEKQYEITWSGGKKEVVSESKLGQLNLQHSGATVKELSSAPDTQQRENQAPKPSSTSKTPSTPKRVGEYDILVQGVKGIDTGTTQTVAHGQTIKGSFKSTYSPSEAINELKKQQTYLKKLESQETKGQLTREEIRETKGDIKMLKSTVSRYEKAGIIKKSEGPASRPKSTEGANSPTKRGAVGVKPSLRSGVVAPSKPKKEKQYEITWSGGKKEVVSESKLGQLNLQHSGASVKEVPAKTPSQPKPPAPSMPSRAQLIQQQPKTEQKPPTKQEKIAKEEAALKRAEERLTVAKGSARRNQIRQQISSRKGNIRRLEQTPDTEQNEPTTERTAMKGATNIEGAVGETEANKIRGAISGNKPYQAPPSKQKSSAGSKPSVDRKDPAHGASSKRTDNTAKPFLARPSEKARGVQEYNLANPEVKGADNPQQADEISRKTAQQLKAVKPKSTAPKYGGKTIPKSGAKAGYYYGNKKLVPTEQNRSALDGAAKHNRTGKQAAAIKRSGL